MTFKGSIEYMGLLRELVKYRKDRRLSQQDVATALGFSLSKVNRGETGRSEIEPADLDAYMDLYRIPQAERERLRKLRDQKYAPEDSWWRDLSGLDMNYALLIEAEHVATLIVTATSGFVPGLFQTPTYFRDLNYALGITDEDVILEGIAIRGKRQEILLRETPPQLRAIVSQSALCVGKPETLKAQLLAIRGFMELPNVDLRYVPDLNGIPLMDGTHLSFPDGSAKHFLDIGGFNIELDDPGIVKRMRRRLEAYGRYATTPEATLKFIESKIKEM